MSLPNTIAVDGPAGSGKSSVSFAVAQRLNYLFVDTGAFYRAVTFLALERHVDPQNAEHVTAIARNTHLDMKPDLQPDGRQYTLLADGRDITPYIHSPEVDAHVSVIAANPGAREALLDVQRNIAARGKVIMAGRDISTVVLPDADLKLYIDASLDQRAQRRHEQRMRSGEPADLPAIRTGLASRDSIDSARETAPLQRAPDAHYLDTTSLSFEDSVEAVLDIIHRWKPST